jgi:hypothetical protein
MRRLVEGGTETGEMLEHVGAEIGNHALAEPVHAIEAGCAGDGENEADAEQRREIFVDQIRLDPGKAEIDHAPHGKRHRECGGGRNNESHQSAGKHPFVAGEIRFKRE